MHKIYLRWSSTELVFRSSSLPLHTVAWNTNAHASQYRIEVFVEIINVVAIVKPVEPVMMDECVGGERIQSSQDLHFHDTGEDVDIVEDAVTQELSR